MTSEYATTIMDHLDAQRGSERTPSSLDWQIMNAWFDRGVTLPVICGAITGGFAYLKVNRPSDIARVGLPYFYPAIEDAWDVQRDLMVGSNTGGAA